MAYVEGAGHTDDSWRAAGSIAWSRGDFAASWLAFRNALSLRSHSPMHWCNLGLALRELSRTSEAIHCFQVAIALDASYAPAHNEWANVLVDLGRCDEALPRYTHALRLAPHVCVYHHNQGVCLRLLGRGLQARRALQAALAIDPGYAWSQAELARLDKPADT
jgi:tetratricopeptide (TPR) repeat protein